MVRGWAVTDLEGTNLRSFRLLFECHRTARAQRGVPPRGIIEALNVIEHVRFGLVSRAVRFSRCAFGLEQGEETLHRGMVSDVASSAHAPGDAVVGQEPMEGLTGVWAAPICVMPNGLRLASPPDGHPECIGDTLPGQRRMHGLADDPSREANHNRRDGVAAFGGSEAGEMGLFSDN